MAKFETKGKDLYIAGKKVLRGWESFSGWYWFATEKVEEIDGDTIWYGLVQGFYEEWGTFSQRELEALHPKVWEIPHRNLPWSGRREPRGAVA